MPRELVGMYKTDGACEADTICCTESEMNNRCV